MSMSASPRFRGLVALLHPRPFPVRGFASPHLSPSPARLTSRTPLSGIATSTSPSTSPSHRRHFTSTPTTMAATEATLRKFFQSPQYAVVGASTNTQKYGFKVFRWYVDHNLPVTPVNPTSKSIPVAGVEHPTVASLSELEKPTETGISFITPPPVTLKTLKEAKELGVPSVFLQPGTYNDEVLRFAEENFQAVVVGDGGWGGEGWCVLVDGERGLKAVGKL